MAWALCSVNEAVRLLVAIIRLFVQVEKLLSDRISVEG